MKITILTDNSTLGINQTKAEWGWSVYIEDEEEKVLFDTGASGLFIENAQKLGINLDETTSIIFSHGHLDHTWGINSLINYFRIKNQRTNNKNSYLETNPRIIAHPLTFNSKISAISEDEIGPLISEEKLAKHFKIEHTTKPYWLTNKLVYLGEIERNNNFEAQEACEQIVINNIEKDDWVKEDSALAYKTEKGIVVITGCSHSGICNIIEYAKKVCKDDRVIDVIGGFHLIKPKTEQLQGTLEYFKGLNAHNLHACHCVDLNSKLELSKIANIQESGVGLSLEF